MAEPQAEATWDDLAACGHPGLELGYRLIPGRQDPRKRPAQPHHMCAASLRRRWALPPPVHIRDNLELRPSQYRIPLRGAVVGEAEACPACGWPSTPGHATQSSLAPHHRPGLYPLPAVWIENASGNGPNGRFYTVVDCSTVVATHLSHLMQVHAAKFWAAPEPSLVEHDQAGAQLIEEVIPEDGRHCHTSACSSCCWRSVHIRDIRSIIECLAEYAPTVTDLGAHPAHPHIAPAIVQQIYGSVKELDVIALEPWAGAPRHRP